MAWICSACTYRHAAPKEFYFLACSICQTKRPAQAIAPGPKSPARQKQRLLGTSTPLQRQSLKRKRAARVIVGDRNVNDVLCGKKRTDFYPSPKVRIQSKWVHVQDTDLSKYGPLSVVMNVLDKAAAADLLKEMRSDVTWKSYKWHLAGKTVDVHRKSCTLLLNGDSGSEEYELSKTKQVGSALVHEAARKMVQVVRELRPRAKWKPTYALANRYMNGSETVGFHSDHLAEIGPQAVIVGLSLGATRRFDMKRTEPVNSEGCVDAIQVYVPHNSAVIMWADAQENWQHAVPKCDNSKIYRHKEIGLERYSLTFRMRRTDMPKFE